ncbi:MAG: AraC family ligand binding domain-containing protein [Rhodoferax sp.]|uniref:AraC family ligand binding domain-containing protein n=1 Tax=Rhodoferax sp. TaxID=50421 RepID=UPI003265BFCC
MTDRVHYQQIAGLPGLVLSAARFADFSFGRHVYLDYHIGVVNEGVQRQMACILQSAA